MTYKFSVQFQFCHQILNAVFLSFALQTSNCCLQIRFCALNCDVQISVFKLWCVNSVFQIPFSRFLYPVSHLGYSGLGYRVFRQKKTEIKMADEKYSKVIKLLRRAESLLSSIPSPNKQLLRQRGVWRQNGHAPGSVFKILHTYPAVWNYSRISTEKLIQSIFKQ